MTNKELAECVVGPVHVVTRASDAVTLLQQCVDLQRHTLSVLANMVFLQQDTLLQYEADQRMRIWEDSLCDTIPLFEDILL